MHSFAYTLQSLEGLYRRVDRVKYAISSEDIYKAHVANLRDRINSNLFPYHFKFSSKGSRRICSVGDYETALLVRKVNSDFQAVAGVSGTVRSETTKAIRCICAEGVPYTIVRLDIKRFYESIDVDHLIDVVSEVTRRTYALRRNLEGFLRWSKANIGGIPTGLSLSASLAELYISRQFDRKVRALPGVNFYTRYVDDIIMICAPSKSGADYISDVAALLPPGLEFNSSPEKKTFLDLHSEKSSGSFEYLGYAFHVGSTLKISGDAGREIIVDIAQKKINRRKTRFVQSLLQFLKDGSEADLRRRYLLINSGYTYRDTATDRIMSAGMCNTYSEIDFPSAALSELRAFYRFCLLSKNFRLRARLDLSHLSSPAIRAMLALDPNEHVKHKKYISISRTELSRLTRCWKDV